MALYNNELNRETFITSFLGMERCDFIIYLAKLLRASKILVKKKTYNNVLVIDNSRDHELFNLVSLDDMNDELDVADYQGVTFIKNAIYAPTEFIKYDHVLVWHGMNVDKDIVEKSDFVYVITNYEKNMSKKLGDEMMKCDFSAQKITIIYREKNGKKISEKVINHHLCIDDKDIKAQYLIPYDAKDYALYLNLTHNGTQRIKNLSQPYSLVLETIIREIAGLKSIKQGFINKLAKK